MGNPQRFPAWSSPSTPLTLFTFRFFLESIALIPPCTKSTGTQSLHTETTTAWIAHRRGSSLLTYDSPVTRYQLQLWVRLPPFRHHHRWHASRTPALRLLFFYSCPVRLRFSAATDEREQGECDWLTCATETYSEVRFRVIVPTPTRRNLNDSRLIQTIHRDCRTPKIQQNRQHSMSPLVT